jgi:hypothetical protein
LLLRRLHAQQALNLRCAELVLALDEAATTARDHSQSLHRRPQTHAILDIGRLLAQGLLEAGPGEGALRQQTWGLEYGYKLRASGPGRFGLVLRDGNRPAGGPIEVLATRPGFGGKRYWFVCRCGRRVLRLFLPDGRLDAACRTCHHVTDSRSGDRSPPLFFDIAVPSQRSGATTARASRLVRPSYT